MHPRGTGTVNTECTDIVETKVIIPRRIVWYHQYAPAFGTLPRDKTKKTYNGSSLKPT
jgi:hypothetical protein